MATGRAAARSDPPLTPTELRSLRRLFVVAGVVYFVWWFIAQAVAPGSYNLFAGRLVVTALFFIALAASLLDPRVSRRLSTVFAACAWALTALLAYSTLTLVLGRVVSLVFLPGLATMTFLSNLTLHQRLLLGVERAERTRADAARTSAEAGVALRDELISIASHELRTPLAALQLAVQGLSRAARRAEGPPSADLLDRTLETCQRQTARLSRLVDALLDASRITNGRFVLVVEEVPLVARVRDVAQMLAGDAARAGSSITIDGDAEVCGRWDRMRLEQLVSNLLRNAIIVRSRAPDPRDRDRRNRGGEARRGRSGDRDRARRSGADLRPLRAGRVLHQLRRDGDWPLRGVADRHRARRRGSRRERARSGRDVRGRPSARERPARERRARRAERQPGRCVGAGRELARTDITAFEPPPSALNAWQSFVLSWSRGGSNP